MQTQSYRDGKLMPWADRFALIEQFQPDSDQICVTFGITMEELVVARQLQDEGILSSTPTVDVKNYSVEFFTVVPASKLMTVPTSTADVDDIVIPEFQMYTPPPPTLNEDGTIAKTQKRGRGGSKITDALLAVPTVAVPVEQFATKMDVSVAVLRQSTRFIKNMTPEQQAIAGSIFVRKDPNTKVLMIWKEVS